MFYAVTGVQLSNFKLTIDYLKTGKMKTSLCNLKFLGELFFFGVQQGSILKPVLHNIFMNNLYIGVQHNYFSSNLLLEEPGTLASGLVFLFLI